MPRIRFPDNLSAQDFLDQYWQKKPLLIRNAIVDYEFDLSPDELGGLSLEAGIESRMVIQHGPQSWELKHGPFDEELYASLPDHHWTVLVQDVDKFLPEVAQLKKAFGFIPDWRADDIMISYAEDQGSVGPHTDTYDVFLIQAYGQRRWQISCADFSKAELLPDLPVRVLKEFEPEQEWVLEPGDVLYLPPGVAHWGLAEGPCMTYSMGYRAPSMQEMVDDFAQFVIDRVPETDHYQDWQLQVPAHSAEIGQAAMQAISNRMQSLFSDEAVYRRWFGCFVTQIKPQLMVEPPQQALSPLEFASYWAEGLPLERHPFARFACYQDQSAVLLFCCGEAFEIQNHLLPLVQQICESESIAETLDEDELALLSRMYNLGYLVFLDE